MFLLLAFAVFIYLWYFGLKIYWKRKNVPFQNALPLFGNMAGSFFKYEHLTETMQRLYDKNSDAKYFGFFNMMEPIVIIRDLELFKMITVKDFDAFPSHMSFTNDDADPLWNKNLFAVQEMERWRYIRATLSPSFTSSKMRMLFKLMNECSTNFVDYYLQKDGTIKIDARDTFERYANDIIATTAFGITVDSLKHRTNEFYLKGKDATNFEGLRILKFILYAVSPFLAKILRVKVFSDEVGNFFRGIIKDSIRLREEQGIVRPDIIHLLMEARKGKDKKEPIDVVQDNSFAVIEESELIRNNSFKNTELTDDDITAQALIFFFAGFDTVATMMSFTAMELAVHPEIQIKLTQEIDKLYKKSGSNPSYEDILQLKYLDMVLSESLRKWPPSIFSDRKSAKLYTLPPAKEGHAPCQLPKDSIVWIPIFSIHRDENYYLNPEVFDPERFSDKNKSKIKPFTYLPFGAGPRNCIGSRFALLEVKVVFYHILAKFELVPTGETKIPFEYDKKSTQMALRGGFKIKLRRRIK